MPSRIQNLFAKQKAHIAYLTAGDGGIAHTLSSAIALIEGGVNLLEIGFPFSDPIADGPVIQRASSRALAFGTTLEDVIWLIREIRQKSDIPLVLFTYLNPILKVFDTDFLLKAKQAGLDGLLVVDCPLEESMALLEECRAHQVDMIYVVTPSTSLDRIKEINSYAGGFIYYACQVGTTGVRSRLPEGRVCVNGSTFFWRSRQ